MYIRCTYNIRAKRTTRGQGARLTVNRGISRMYVYIPEEKNLVGIKWRWFFRSGFVEMLLRVSIAVLGPSLESPHAIVPLVSPLDHYRSLRQHQSVAPITVVFLTEDQIQPEDTSKTHTYKYKTKKLCQTAAWSVIVTVAVQDPNVFFFTIF